MSSDCCQIGPLYKLLYDVIGEFVDANLTSLRPTVMKFVYMVFDFDNPTSEASNKFGSAPPLDLEIGGSKGDSGGGIFVQVDNEWQLVGIVSGALNREIKYGAVAAVTCIAMPL